MQNKSLAMTRRAAAGALAVLAATGGATSVRAAEGEADFLFVQTAEGVEFDLATATLRLKAVSSVTTFFADRPERVAGHMTTAAFVPFWSEGKDSFLSDPPNADVSILKDGELIQTIVVLKDPRLEGDDLVYSIEILEGEPPATGEDVSVFIDVIGMPLTPVSVAGRRRRIRRRVIIR
jgi:hypothetical protein